MGMEEYFVKMHTCPEVVDALTRRILDFYGETNRRFFDAAAGRMEAFFFGNDLGTQQDLLISPACFERFVLPGIREVVDLARSRGLPVLLHSCGAVSKIIPALVGAGIDALHPLQAKAADMEASLLGPAFRDRIAFVGGVDTQELLPRGAPEDVRREVRRLRECFGERFVVSPSHEAVFPDVPIENLAAMEAAARERL